MHVIERDLSGPDRIVGEYLQPGGYLKWLSWVFMVINFIITLLVRSV